MFWAALSCATPPPPRLNPVCFGAMGAGVYLLCCPPRTAVGVNAAHFLPLLLRFVWALSVYPTVRLGAALMLRFWWMVPFLPLFSIYTANWCGCCHHLYWTESRPISCCILAHRYFRYLQQGHHNTISVSIASLRVVPVPPSSPTPHPSAALSTDNKQLHVYQ